MKNLKFRDDPEAMERLADVQERINDFLGSHTRDMSEEDHGELRELFSERAAALSVATGKKIHSLFD